MPNTVTITIDGVEYEVPEGMNLVDAAKMCGTDIPVFCYHPKVGFDGNCRMCLVELGTPRKNRETGEMELAWFPTLQTSCTQKTQEGMAIRTKTDKVTEGRREILEFLLSSHPLDCPICDKGGECPLQNLTMAHGPGTSRMYWDEKMRLGKHIPLGDLIYLDQERCILCSRCIRYQDEIADDPVLEFDERGRSMRIITNSTPGFDSIFSGNTTDICPVGALTTADFRFNARPWEMVQVATVCTHCPVGCNMSFDTRTDREAGGRTTIKRVMPRQNEQVNEVWICDKGRFAHHYMEDPDRLTQPLIRQGGKLVETTWEEALEEIVAQFLTAGAEVAAIGGGRLSNEDAYALQKLIRGRGSNDLAAYPHVLVDAGDAPAQFGVGVGTDLQLLGEGDAILVAASDLHQEAPIWWLRVFAAAKRGAALIVLNGRETRLDEAATHRIRVDYGGQVAAVNAMLSQVQSAGGGDDALAEAAKAFAEAENAVAFVGGEGLDAAGSRALAGAVGGLLAATGHVGRADNGLIAVWSAANGQGLADMGLSPRFGPGYAPLDAPGRDYAAILDALSGNALKAIIIAGADPVFDDPAAEQALRKTKATIIVQDMFLTATAELADVVLPTQSAAEREGTYTSGERRVQRFYPAIEPVGASQPDWHIVGLIAEGLGDGPPPVSAAALMLEISEAVPHYAGITYQALSRVVEQWPDVGGEDLYYGGTAFQNFRGIGIQWAAGAEAEGASIDRVPAPAGDILTAGEGRMVVVPVRLVYDAEPVVFKTGLLHAHIPVPHVGLNPADAEVLGVEHGDMLSVTLGGREIMAAAYLDGGIPAGVATMPRRLQPQGAPLAVATATIKKAEKVEA